MCARSLFTQCVHNAYPTGMKVLGKGYWLGPSHLQMLSFTSMNEYIFSLPLLSQVLKVGHSFMCAINKCLSCSYDITDICLVQREQVN